MSRYTSIRLAVAVAVAITLTACAEQSPVAPGGLSSTQGSSLDAKPSSGGVPGVYALSFYARVNGGAYQEVTTLPVLSTSLILKAQVTDTLGNPATTGTVNFEYCSYGGRTNDINNPDEAPKEACELGQAKWARLDSWTVGVLGGNCLALGSGSACYPFGIVRIPRSLGFRFRYAQQKSSIASGTSPARNFVWTAQ